MIPESNLQAQRNTGSYLLRGNMTAKRLITGILAVLVIAAVMAPSMMAQSLISGDLTGTVTDPSGAVVSGATVTLQSLSTGATRNATTGANGTYRFSLLSPGQYTVTVTATGFSKAQTQTTVNVGQATIADMKMAVGANTQTVEVTSVAPLVQADNADLSTNFNQGLISNQPNGGNDLTYIAQTAPGVTMNVGQGYGNFSAYGLPATSNLFTVNGENDMDPYLNLNNSGATNLTLGRNEVQEATVISNAYSGQYGQQAGAQINYVTKSGTNNYHGNVAYWWTGRALDANDWFNNLSQTPRPFANNNEWAASIGGPIKKDKLFFFVNNEGIRYIVPSSTPVFTPSPAFINATLNNLATGTYNAAFGLGADPAALPVYNQLFHLYQTAPGYNGNNFQSGSCIDSNVGLSLGPGDAATPGLGVPGLTNDNCISQYQATPALPGTEFIISGRIDYNLSDNDHLWWRVRLDHGTQATSADPINNAFSAASYQPSYDGQGQWNHVFSPNATNQFIYAGSYYRAIFTQNNPGLFPYATDGADFGFNLTPLAGSAFAFPQGRNVTQYQFVDDFSWTKGVHALKFGANFRRYDITDYTFTTYTHPLIAFLGPADLFTDSTYRFQQRFPLRDTEPVALWGLGIYGQDEWRVSKSLKLTLALRLEKNSNPVCQTNCASLMAGNSFQQVQGAIPDVLASPATPYNQLVLANRHQVFRATDAINVAPRFGFAWSPGGNDKTVVRGGFGMFYDALPAFIGDAFMANLPNRVEERPAYGFYGSNPFGWADPGASTLTAGCAAAIQSGFSTGASWNDVSSFQGANCRKPTFNTQAGTFHTPYWEQWSIGIQQAVGDKASLGLTYVGNHGVHIPIYNEGLNGQDPSQIYGGTFPTTAPAGDFAVTEQYESTAVSNYNGITASYNQRVMYGFSVQASYTWSHTLDEISNAGGEPYNGLTSQQYQFNPICLRCQYGNADYDIRNSFNASFVWQTPFKFSDKYVEGAFGGWTLSMNFFARSGLPYNIVNAFQTISNYGPSFAVASINQFAQNSCTNGLSQCVPFQDASGTPINPVYNIPALTGQPLGFFTNQRRNQYRGPGFFDSDFSINKNFKLTERLAFGVGANFYNVFNHPNFTNPDNFLGDSTFGQILQTTAPPTGPYGSFFTGLPSGRIVQFQGKLVF
jgi:hypothetical protein